MPADSIKLPALPKGVTPETFRAVIDYLLMSNPVVRATYVPEREFVKDPSAAQLARPHDKVVGGILTNRNRTRLIFETAWSEDHIEDGYDEMMKRVAFQCSAMDGKVMMGDKVVEGRDWWKSVSGQAPSTPVSDILRRALPRTGKAGIRIIMAVKTVLKILELAED